MKNIRNILVLLCSLFSQQAMAQNASDILEKAAAAYNNSNGISATFDLHTRMNGQGGESFEGQIQMKGEKFVLITPDTHIWFDGTTQWVYMARNEEVYISNPSGDELETTNPIVLLRSYKKGYNAALKGESTAINGKTAYNIELTPKQKNSIIKVELQIEKLSFYPSRISVEMKNGIYSTIQLNQLRTGVNQADTLFVFKKADYPNVEIID